MVEPATIFVGRSDELRSLEDGLDLLDAGRPCAAALVGEPGIGKTRLLSELARRAESRGHLALSGSASELDRNLPFSVFVGALDDYLASLEPKLLAALDDDIRAELARVFPSLARLARGADVALHHERYRTHRAIRTLLDQLAVPAPLLIELDDVHWADAASLEVLAALLRRPPSGAVLIAVAFRPRQLSERLTAALERARRDAALIWLELGVFSWDDARELLGGEVAAHDAAVLYEESGGNPFYLEQLARSREFPVHTREHAALTVTGVPDAVARSLGEELSMLSVGGRHVLDGAAIAGDPFELELAAAAAAVSEETAMNALDECLRVDLVRNTEVPRRFRFRHPLLRRAVYEETPGGWRVGAHERCARALARRGAPVAARAYHIERSARVGDTAAVAVLRDAGEASASVAPAAAAAWFAGAVRLLPQTAPVVERVELLLARARALAAAGRFADSRDVLLEGLATPVESTAMRTRLAISCARIEHRLGRYEQAHARLLQTLDSLQDSDSGATVALLIELALNEFYRADYESMHLWGERAVSSAEILGDAPLLGAALAMPALADAMTGDIERARIRVAEAAAAVDSFSDEQLGHCLDGAVWLAAAELYLDLHASADIHARRALALARSTGQGELYLVLHQILGRIWCVRGNLAEATELLDGAIESARLSGNTQALVGVLFNRSVVALAVGELDVAVDTARESVELARGLDEGFVASWASVRLARALLETGDPVGAAELLARCTSGDYLRLIPAGWKPHCLELLTRCSLALGQRADAEDAAARAAACAAAVQLPLASSWADRAAAALALHDDDAERAAALARRSAIAADEVLAPIDAALARTLAGRALAAAGHRDEAIVELRRAADALDACGALHYRDEAERELGKLGHRMHRRTKPGVRGAAGVESLTGRELEITRLVVDRKTNSEIAAELFLSQKTVETHLRNIFHKMNVTSRAALARAVERAQTFPTRPGVTR